MKDPVDRVQIIKGAPQRVREWLPPEMGAAAAVPAAGRGGLPTAAELEALQLRARAEGFEQGRREGQEYGHREGLEEGRTALLEQLNRFELLLEALNRPFEQMDDQVEREIVTLVISMVRQLVRREVKMDPGHIVGVVREALGVLPVAARGIRLVLHPEDAALIRDIYALGETEQKWQIVEDPVIQRGGCRVLTDTSRVDATLESRLNVLIAPLLAGERDADADDGTR